MKSKSQAAFEKVLETDSLTDIALIKGTLDARKIQYFIQGENLKSIRPVDPAVLMVAKQDVDKAIELLKSLKLNYVWFAFDARTRHA